MAQTWTISDLEYWDEKIREKVDEFGLTCFPQEFEVCDHEQMLGYMAYHGMPAHYPHWSYGKSYEKLKTLYDYGVSGLPYELVINTNPCLAYLMRDNSLCLQVLTIAHVYAHNDFFRTNHMFGRTRPDLRISHFKARADRVRSYMEDPSIGVERVESILDAAHALSLQCNPNPDIRRLSRSEQIDRAMAAAEPKEDPFHRVHKPQEYSPPDLSRLPLEPEENLLPFIAEHNSYLSEWERDLLYIVHEEAQYFVPQIETKIMNEGWASYWHHKLMNALDLPEALHLEFLVHHNQVIRPHRGELNPYHVGFIVWHDIERRYTDPTPEEIEAYGEPETGPMQKLFEVRESDRDASFLRRFLSERLMREMDMFEYRKKGSKFVVSKVSDAEDWVGVKQTLLHNIGMAGVPKISVLDADYRHSRMLYMRHDHDGRDLELEHLEKTLGYVRRLWGRTVFLETQMQGKAVVFSYEDGRLRRSAR